MTGPVWSAGRDVDAPGSERTVAPLTRRVGAVVGTMVAVTLAVAMLLAAFALVGLLARATIIVWGLG